jgi:hypothetical protein
MWIEGTNDGAVVVQNKSSLILKFIFTNKKILQLLTKNIKIKIVYKSYKKCQAIGLGLRYLESCD